MAEKKTKRLVKNPESFRERAIKAAEQTDKPQRRRVVRQVGSRLVSPVKPIRQAAQTVFDRQPFRRLRRPFRLIGAVILPVYLRNSWRELKLVTWPNWRESRRLTFAVLTFAIIFGAVIALVDYGLDKVFKNILLK